MRHLTHRRFFLLLLAATFLALSSGCNCDGTGMDRCIPSTCDELGKNCGTIDDTCGRQINCGYCGADFVCGLFEENVCGKPGADPSDPTGEQGNPLSGCRSSDCIELGVECGAVGDGCGAEQVCGFCPGGMSCGGGNDPGRCGQSVCTPNSCDAVGAECGSYPDGCGGVLSCGECDGESACGGGGAYRCGTGVCTTNPDCTDRCGYVPDGCGGVVMCPSCAEEEICAAGRCSTGSQTIGDRCTADLQCGSGYCLTEYEHGWHGGYCTAPCGSDIDCGEGGVCGYLNENGSGICLVACLFAADCDSGYVCAVPEGGLKSACIPGGTGGGSVGDTCRTSADCDGDADGFCLRPEDGFPGGYCTVGCGEDGPCPEGSACAFDSAGRGICVELCSSSEDCDGDYRCRNVGGFLACWPAGGLGDACVSHDDCASDACLSATPHGWPGGYCTDLCETNADCGTGNQCLPHGPNGQLICVVGCASNADCRDGYACTITMNGGRACLPYGGAGDGGSGGHCNDGDCVDIICTPTTCQAQGASCGTLPDGCGGLLECGGCADGQSCGGGGAFTCGSGCVPNLHCGTRCGVVADGCSDVIQCGNCVGDGICSDNRCMLGAGSIGNPCADDDVCASGNCLTEEESQWAGGYCTSPCGSDVDCGSGNVCGYFDEDGNGFCLDSCTDNSDCREGYVCGVVPGTTQTACIPGGAGSNDGNTCVDGTQSCLGNVCTPTTCAEAGVTCGRYPTGCGGVLECGGCAAGEHCGGGGPYTCGTTCVPDRSCDDRCGRVSDGCGAMVNCPPCPETELCFVGQCTDGADSIGDSCFSDAGCATGHCLTEDESGWEGGYCTLPCGSNADCGEGNVCGYRSENGGGICLTSCSADSDCRDGYMCDVVPGGSGMACIPSTTEPGSGGSGGIGDPCNTTADCQGGADAVCVSTPAGGRCSVRCESDQECPSEYHCVTDGTVVPGFCQLTDTTIDYCSIDADCGPGKICVETPTGRICGTGCNSDTDCPSGMVCTSDEVFGGGGFCQPSDPEGTGGGGPGSPCSFSDDCESGYCIPAGMGYPGGYCAEPCDSNLDCASGYVCAPGGPGGQTICMPDCNTNRDCRDGYECVAADGGRSACMPERGDGVAGDDCQTSEDCALGHVCIPNYTGQSECVETCTGAGECGEGMACRPTDDPLGTGTCEPGDEHGCSTDVDCPPGQVCGVSMGTQNFTCVDEESGGVDWGMPDTDDWGGPRKTGDPCTLSDQCERMQCYPENTTGWAEGYCTGTCSSDNDCSDGSICGLKRILEIKTDPSGGFTIEDVTELFGYDPGMGISFNSASATKLLMRIIMKWLLDSLFGDFEGKVTIGQCLKHCSGDGDCRFGYRCIQVDADGTRGCIPYADGPGAVGDSCRLIPDCSGGLPGYCMMNDSGYPDGYCSLNCRGNPSVCPSGSRCVKLQDDLYTCMKTTPCNVQALGAKCEWWRCEPDPTCWYWDDGWGWWRYDSDLCCDTGRSCTPFVPCPINREWECTAHRRNQTGFCSDCVGTDRCRPDYACYSPDNGVGVCHPSAKGSRSVGQTCTRLRDCLYGVDGVCFFEADGGDGSKTWQGGYCSKSCGSCPSGSRCGHLITGGKYCLKSCSNNSNCRAGYTCEVISKRRSWSWSSGCSTTTHRACVPSDDIVDVQLSSSWACSDPK